MADVHWLAFAQQSSGQRWCAVAVALQAIANRILPTKVCGLQSGEGES
jgi:hypothetical protein